MDLVEEIQLLFIVRLQLCDIEPSVNLQMKIQIDKPTKIELVCIPCRHKFNVYTAV